MLARSFQALQKSIRVQGLVEDEIEDRLRKKDEEIEGHKNELKELGAHLYRD